MPVDAVTTGPFRVKGYQWRCLECGGRGIVFSTRYDATVDLTGHWGSESCQERN